MVKALPVHEKALIYSSSDTQTPINSDQEEDFPF